MSRQVVLDTETTGLSINDDHRIIEIGCIELVDRRFSGRNYHKYINPMRSIDSQAQAVHGIGNEFLQDKPVFADIVDELVDFLHGAELIIHNAPFDVGFINHELGKVSAVNYNIDQVCKVIDSLVLAKKLHPGQRNSLDALCRRYKIDNTERKFHGALLDANLLARVYLAMTGGQASLFSSDEALISEMVAKSTIEIPEINQQTETCKKVSTTAIDVNLPVIFADEAELALHNKKVEDLSVNGCIWGVDISNSDAN